MVDRVTPRKDLPAVLGSILTTLMMGRGRKAASFAGCSPSGELSRSD